MDKADLKRLTSEISAAIGTSAAIAAFVICLPGAEQVNEVTAVKLAQQLVKLTAPERPTSEAATHAELAVKAMVKAARKNHA